MKLYYIPAACSLAPHIILREMGLDATLIKVDHKTHLTETGCDYYEVNPLGYVPALELEDGVILREGAAIVQFLGDLKPELGLLPVQGCLDRYRLQEWLSFLAGEIHKGFIPLLYSALAGRYIETVRPKLEQRFVWIDAQLEGRAYLMGNHFSVADAYLFALVGWGQASWLTSYYKAEIHIDALPNLQAWYERVRARPAVQTALQEEGLL
jgi:glutathione S-transferase